MRKLSVLIALVVLAATPGTRAQLRVKLSAEQDIFLLYEAIPVTLEIQNFSGRTVELAGEGGKTWLNFVVTDEHSNIIPPTKESMPNETLLIPAGETVSRSVDLLPLYELRQRGFFKAQAYVTSGSVSAMSQPFVFSLMRGRELASVTKGLPPQEGEPEQYRTYSLVMRTLPEGDLLYAMVRDDANDRVFELTQLGKSLSTMKPEFQVDRDANFHALFQSGPRAFGYARISSNGRLLERKVFSDYISTPALSAKDGVVTVTGGEQVFPKVEHIMTEDELNPPPPPPPVKKKPWWKFWGSSSSTTNAPAPKKP
jgi:hypothetical protein